MENLNSNFWRVQCREQVIYSCSNPIFFIIQGSKRLKLANSDDYNLIHIKNDTEETIEDEDSFDNLPKSSTLRFKKRSPNFNAEAKEGLKIRRAGQASIESPIAGTSGGVIALPVPSALTMCAKARRF